jgi:hypothetical protein
MAKREYLEDILKEVNVRDIERVHLPSARALFADISSKTENPYKPGQFGSANPSMLSTSVKFEKNKKIDDPVLSRVEATGMYLMPAGKHGCADVCKDKTAGCSAGCLNISGRLSQTIPTQIARTEMLTRHPVEGLALLADEAHTKFEGAIKRGNIASLRVDGTSELHIDNMEAGDFIYGGPGGRYQEKRGKEFGPTAGLPMAMGSEYGKRYAKDVLPGPTPQSRQSNVTRVPSWNESLTKGRAEQLISEGSDIAIPMVNLGTSQNPKPVPSHISMQFNPGGNLVVPAVDYDTHDIIGLRRQTGSAGVLREKKPGFGLDPDLSPAQERAKGRFLREHPLVGEPINTPRKRR